MYINCFNMAKRPRDELFNHEEESKRKKYKVDRIDPLPDDLNNIILKYTLDVPFDDFINKCVEGQKDIVHWLQDVYRFDRNIPRPILSDYFIKCICLSKSVGIMKWYKEIFDICYLSFNCAVTTIKNNNKNYKRFIMEFINSDIENDEDWYNKLFEIIVQNGNLEILKFVIEEEELDLPEEHVSGCSIKNPDMLDYVYLHIKEQKYKNNLNEQFYGYLKSLCIQNDIKSVISYCESHFNILKTASVLIDSIFYPADKTHIIIELMENSVRSLKYHVGHAFADHKLTKPDIIIYLCKTFPPTIDHIRKGKEDVISYLKLTHSNELLNLIKEIIGYDLVFL